MLYVPIVEKFKSWTTLVGIKKPVNNYLLDIYSTFSALEWGLMGL